MNLTGKQLIVQGIINGPAIPEENIQQHGVDLNLLRVHRADGPGIVPRTGKTKLPSYTLVLPIMHEINGYSVRAWNLKPGVYQIDLEQGCHVPPNQMLRIVHRSSLFRNGAQINSALFDAGFKTDHIGTMMIVHIPIIIEVGARVCQIYATASNEVENLYEGQWQGDQQRKQIVS